MIGNSARSTLIELWVKPVIALLLFALCTTFPLANLRAATGEELRDAMYLMAQPELDKTSQLKVNNLSITAHDLEITLIEGDLVFFKPITIGDTSIVYGAFFDGKGVQSFTPQVQMEKDQLHRFFEQDSIVAELKQALFLFNGPALEQLKSGAPEPVENPGKVNNRAMKHLAEYLHRDKNFWYYFRALHNNMEPEIVPYLHVVMNLKSKGLVAYECQPYEEEEVVYKKEYKALGRTTPLETVCRYGLDADSLHGSKYTKSKGELSPEHYDIAATIEKSGNMIARASVRCNSMRRMCQMHELRLHSEMKVDSVLDTSGNQLSFHRFQKDKHRSSQLLVFHDQPLEPEQQVTLTFFYSGEIAEKDLGEFYVHAGAGWYPRIAWSSQRPTFDVWFKSPKQYAFTAGGHQAETYVSNDTLYSHWIVDPPAVNFSFNVGNMKRYDFAEDSPNPIHILYSKDLHNSFGSAFAEEMILTGKNMEKQVAFDVENSLKLFTHYFGPCEWDTIRVTEILAYHGEAFPGLIHLGFDTWVNTDTEGIERLFRSHEVAHQWWGVGVRGKTYHDKWLTEGFSEYSALMYVQAVLGNDKFMDHLETYRDEIYSARKWLFGSGDESGPVALGHRTSSTETLGDYGLIIYKKGAYILHMLRNMMLDFDTMDETRFFDMMKDWYLTHKDQSVTTQDFQRHVEKHAGVEMGWYFDQWVYSTELPEYELDYSTTKGDDGLFYSQCRIDQKNVSAEFKMYVPIEVDFGGEARWYTRALIEGPSVEFELPPMEAAPKKIRLNPFCSVLAKCSDRQGPPTPNLGKK